MATVRIPMSIGELSIHYPTGYPPGVEFPAFPEITGPVEYQLAGEPIEETRARELLTEVLGAEQAERLIPGGRVMGERLDVEGGLFAERPDTALPVPNRADAAWTRLNELRAEAEALGIEVDVRWPMNRLEEEIAGKS